MALATSVGMVLNDDRVKRRYVMPGSSSIVAFAGLAILFVGITLITGCAAKSQSSQTSSSTMTPIYQSPYGPTVYRVEGEDGPEIITVVPGHTPPRGGPRTYHIIQQP